MGRKAKFKYECKKNGLVGSVNVSTSSETYGIVTKTREEESIFCFN